MPLTAIDAGADAALGKLALDRDAVALPDSLHCRGGLEAECEALLTELSARLDPVAWNPWPCHSTISGASIAITASAYSAIGGLPRTPLGEDKALVSQLLMHDAKICYCDCIEVVTSARLYGVVRQAAWWTLSGCVRSNLNPFAMRIWRPMACTAAISRSRAPSRLWRSPERRSLEAWARSLGLSRELERQIAAASTFGRARSLAESASRICAAGRGIKTSFLTKSRGRTDLARLE